MSQSRKKQVYASLEAHGYDDDMFCKLFYAVYSVPSQLMTPLIADIGDVDAFGGVKSNSPTKKRRHDGNKGRKHDYSYNDMTIDNTTGSTKERREERQIQQIQLRANMSANHYSRVYPMKELQESAFSPRTSTPYTSSRSPLNSPGRK